MQEPVVHLYALVWNERRMLPFFLEHYRPFVDRFFLFDDGSDDGSWEYLAEQPDVELSRFSYEGDSFLAAAKAFTADAWKASRGRADFVIVVNVDELIYHPDPRGVFRTARQLGVTLEQSRGWDMVSDAFPTQGPLAQTVQRGVHSRGMTKIVAFDPNAVTEMGYSVGRHNAEPEGRIVRRKTPSFELMHYKYMGEDYVVSRYAELGARMRPGDVAAGYGKAYRQDEASVRAHVRKLIAAARPVLLPAMKAEGRLSEPMPGVFVGPVDQSGPMGALKQIWRADDPFAAPVRQVYTTTTQPGVIRAWYRHGDQTDQISPLAGAARLVLWKPKRPSFAEPPTIIELDARTPTMVVVPPGIWHGFQARGPEPLVLLHMNSAGFDWPATDEDRVAIDHPRFPKPWLAPDEALQQP